VSDLSDIAFPSATDDRPYVAINMVTTIDGKIITGDRAEHVMDLGSRHDHARMRQIEAAVDAVMIGAGTLRATPKLWYDARLIRVVVSSSGVVDRSCRFFTDAPERAHVLDGSRPWSDVFRWMRHELGIERLLVEGGSELNASVLEEGWVDEMFLTVAPKVKLGRLTPTYAGGDPLPRDLIQSYELLSCEPIEDEVFLRYRRRR